MSTVEQAPRWLVVIPQRPEYTLPMFELRDDNTEPDWDYFADEFCRWCHSEQLPCGDHGVIWEAARWRPHDPTYRGRP